MDKNIIIIILLAVSVFSNGNVYAEDYATCEDCIKDFNMGNMDLHHFPIRAEERLALINYFYCKATAKSDITECNRLPDPENASCYKKFNNWQGFFMKLLFSQGASADLIRGCIANELFKDGRSCRRFIEAYVKGDDSACKNLFPNDRTAQDRCRALVTLNETLTFDRDAKDIILFMKAVRDFKLRECQKIKNEFSRIRCQAYLTMDEKICQKEKGLKRFRDRYCREALRRKR